MIYWNNKEIPIPSCAYINHSNGRVFIIEKDASDKKYRKDIGRATSETTMHPNEYYRIVFPGEWEKNYGSKNSGHREVSIGLYGLCLGAASSYNIYQPLLDVYGPQYGNAIMDYCMFSLTERLNVTQLFQERMSDEAVFSKEVYSDSWYSELFGKISSDSHFDFKAAWLKECINRGVQDVWLCIDGSNIDCCVHESDLCEFGKAKSHNESKTIVSYIYAVNAEDGLPVTYVVNNGSMVDSNAIQELVEFLNGYGLRVKGAIVDRGFCYPSVIDLLERMKIDYVVTLLSDLTGYRKMLSEYSETIRWKSKYLVSRNGIFGVTSENPLQLWNTNDRTMYLGLFFNGTAGSIQANKLIRDITAQMTAAENSINNGRKPIIQNKLSKYFIVQDKEKPYSVEFNYEAWDAGMNLKGFFGFGTSMQHSAKEIYDLSILRDASETQYSIMKSQEGYQTTRVHTTPRMLTKHALCFITSILRHAIMKACQSQDLDTNDVIRKMHRIHMIMIENGSYSFVRNLTAEQKKVFEVFGLTQDDFIELTKEYNDRLINPIVSQIHKMPVHTAETKPGRGRKKGSKNKSTLEKEKAEVETREKGEIPPKPKRGRPLGSKDSSPRKKRSDAGKKRGSRKK